VADQKPVKAASRKMLSKVFLTSLKVHRCEFSKK
jgi:hypothetical protein